MVRIAGGAIVWVQSPIALADDTEPDVLRRGAVPYKERDAWAGDALLVVEVADSSLAYDRSSKMRLYAEAGIPECWGSTAPRSPSTSIDVYRTPGLEGYRDVARVAGTATLTLLAFPDVELTATEIFA